MTTQVDAPRSILVIRRDNIGDLVCTTPLLAGLRGHFPAARIEVLANSYNAPVLAGNPDIDAIHVYRKLKHAGEGQGPLGALAARVRTLWQLRQRRLDVVIVAAGPSDRRAARLAKFLAPRRIVFSDAGSQGQHEVERTYGAARKLGVSGPIPATRVVAEPNVVARVRKRLQDAGVPPSAKVIGLHISARRVAQRWPAERFAALAAALHEKLGAATLLFWSPGAEESAQHPGDDRKAAAIQAQAAGKSKLVPWPTLELPELVGGLGCCDAVVCSDGGAMHIAAGLGKPIACFFGDSEVARWRPWGGRHVVLKPESGDVAEVTVEEAVVAASELLRLQA